MAHEGAVEVNMALQKDAMDRAVDARIEQWLKAAEAGKTQAVLNCAKAEPPVFDAHPDANPKADPSKQSGLAGANPIPGLRRPRESLLQGDSRVHVLTGLRSRFVRRGQGMDCNPTPDPVPNPTKQRGTAGETIRLLAGLGAPTNAGGRTGDGWAARALLDNKLLQG